MTGHPPVNLVESRDLVCIVWVSLHFTIHLFTVFFRLICKLANIRDIDLRFSGTISDINFDDIAKFREVGMRRSCIFRNRFFQNLVYNLQTRQVMSIFYLPSYGQQHLGKISTFCSCRDLKRQITLTVTQSHNSWMLRVQNALKTLYNHTLLPTSKESLLHF